MLGFFSHKTLHENPIYTKSRRRLETVSSDEVIRYVDNLHSSMGVSISSMRKSLTNNADEAQIHIEDLRDSANALMAALDVLELRK